MWRDDNHARCRQPEGWRRQDDDGRLPRNRPRRPGRTKHSRAVLDTIAATYDIEVVTPPIPRSIRFAEAPAAGRSIFRTARSTPGAQAYRHIAEGLHSAADRLRMKSTR